MENYYVGQKLSKVEITAIREDGIDVICDCGHVFTRNLQSFKNKPPFSCKRCAKVAHSDTALVADNPLGINIRDNTPIEDIMMKEVSDIPLSHLEARVLKEYRANFKTKVA